MTAGTSVMSVRFRSVAVATALVAALAGCSSGSSKSKDGDDGPAQSTLASIEVTPIGDAPALPLGTPTDTPMVVNVWATWCAPCRKEMPAFESVAARYEGSVRFVGINISDEEPAAQKFIAETRATFDQYLDPDLTVQAAFSITGMPATAFIRADGTVAEVHNGALEEDELEQLLAEQLDVASPSSTGG